MTGSVEVVDKDGNPPTHPNQRFYDKNTGRLVQKGLPQVAQMFPTPYGLSANQGQGDGEFGKAIRNWPTPSANEDAAGRPGSKMQKMLGNHPDVRNQGAGTLNPTWVEWLMGWPLGWTALEPLEMDRFRLWCEQHGIY